MKIKYLGHSGFLIDELLVDPFITGNPLATEKIEDIKCNIVCVTHGHNDHLGDAIKIAKNNNAILVATFEIASIAGNEGIQTEGMNIGGTIKVGDWQIKMEMAVHSCPHSTPCSFIIKKDGKTIYFAGDTAYFLDMTRFKDYNIDIALIPIGDRFTMGIEDALKCVKAVQPKMAIPMHYKTFPILEQSADPFKEKSSVPTEVFSIGEEKEL